MIRLTPEPLTHEGFKPFGEVLEATSNTSVAANDSRFARYMNLANVDIDDGSSGTQISLMICEKPSTLPYTLPLLERHPRGSQAFFPATNFAFYVVVAPPAAEPDLLKLRAFVTNGQQGINMARGVWHNPMIGMTAKQRFLVVDCGLSDNCDEFELAETVILEQPR